MKSYQPVYAKQLSTVELDDVLGTRLLPAPSHRAARICREIVRCLSCDCRLHITRLFRETRIPVSILDNLRRRGDFRLVLEPKGEGR